MADPILLNRIIPAPLQAENFSADFNAWLAVFIDELNEIIAKIEYELNNI